LDIKHYQKRNPESRKKIKLEELLTGNLRLVNGILKYIKELKPELLVEYIPALTKRYEETMQRDTPEFDEGDFSLIGTEYKFVNANPELRNTVIRWTLATLSPMGRVPVGEPEIEVLILDWLRASEVLRYHRVKVLTELMGREKGIQLWKDLVEKATDDARREDSKEVWPPIQEIADGWREHGETSENDHDFIVAQFDEHKVLLKFNRCAVHEAVRHLEDSEIAYLATCWPSHPDNASLKRYGMKRRKLTPQTLHTHPFCIEFFWDNDVHPDTELPDKEFMENLGEA
jgi:hypothetical protein